MDRFLSRLIRHQQASLTVRPYEGHSLEGELSIVVAGSVHTFTKQRGNIGEVVAALEDAFVGYDWASGVPVVEVHSGVAEVVSGDATIVDFDVPEDILQVDFDRLEKGYCPDCNVKLGMHERSRNQCPVCHWSWPESSGIYHYAISSVAGDGEWFYRIYQGNHLLGQSSAGSVEQAEELAKHEIEQEKIEQLNGIDLGAAFTAMNRRIREE